MDRCLTCFAGRSFCVYFPLGRIPRWEGLVSHEHLCQAQLPPPLPLLLMYHHTSMQSVWRCTEPTPTCHVQSERVDNIYLRLFFETRQKSLLSLNLLQLSSYVLKSLSCDWQCFRTLISSCIWFSRVITSPAGFVPMWMKPSGQPCVQREKWII